MHIFSLFKNEKIIDIISKIIGITLQNKQNNLETENLKKIADENSKILTSLLREIELIRINLDNLKKMIYAVFIINTLILLFVIINLIKVYANN